jgi:hypothetical protein
MLPGFIELNGISYLYAAGALALVWWGVRRHRGGRGVRRGQPSSMSKHLPDRHTQLNPKLAVEQKQLAERIVATASSGLLPGYDILRQIEAVYVDGFRHPEEALVGLKAAAAMKGANAVIHVHHERTAAGRCTASGDAVWVRAVELGETSLASQTSKDNP